MADIVCVRSVCKRGAIKQSTVAFRIGSVRCDWARLHLPRSADCSLHREGEQLNDRLSDLLG